MVSGRLGQLCATAGPAASQPKAQAIRAASAAYLGRMYRRVVITDARSCLLPPAMASAMTSA
jgi:hypothetical protein